MAPRGNSTSSKPPSATFKNAIRAKRITASDLVKMYLARIKAYNGVCVSQPEGVLGLVSPVPHAGQINALMTLNLRPAERKKWVHAPPE
jgi:amidase